jgi:DnaJ-class molecular chaperone
VDAVSLPKREPDPEEMPCPDCKGTGSSSTFPIQGCKKCGGSGEVLDYSKNDAYWNRVNDAIDERRGK